MVVPFLSFTGMAHPRFENISIEMKHFRRMRCLKSCRECLTIIYFLVFLGLLLLCLQPEHPISYSHLKNVIGISSIQKFNHNFTLNRLVDSIGNATYLLQNQTKNTKNTMSSMSTQSPVFENNSILIDRRVAQEVSEKVRVLCWIPSRNIHRHTKLRAVNETWAKRCDKIIYFITKPNFTSIDVVDTPIIDSRRTLTDKTVFAHEYIYKNNYVDQFDWFLKADDDTYFIMENLKFLLSKFNLKIPSYIGYQFKHFSPEGYMSGGAGYAFNSLGIKAIVEEGYHIPGRCRLKGGPEDIETGRCAYKAGVRSLDQLDVTGKQTFFPSNVRTSIRGQILDWLISYSRTKPPDPSLSCCSPLLVSFHYMTEKLMYIMEFLLYRVVVHGRREIISKAEGMFRGNEAPKIPRNEKRKPYPGEKLEDYYMKDWR